MIEIKSDKKKKFIIILLYIIAAIFLYIGITLPINPQISLDAIISNTKKVIFLLLAAMLGFLVDKVSKPFLSYNSRIIYFKLIFSLISIAAMMFALKHLIFNMEDGISGLIYLLEIVTITTFTISGLTLLNLLIYKNYDG
ncbi:MAG: hypothetical protein ACO2ON_02600 [Candidatus Nanopusillus sp.]